MIDPVFKIVSLHISRCPQIDLDTEQNYLIKIN